jgi:hypothetical protein
MARRESGRSRKQPGDDPDRARRGEELRTRDEISRVKEQHEDELLSLPNVTGVFTDYKTTRGRRTERLSIVVTVREKKDVAAKDRIPEEINGIPTDVIEEEIVPMQMATGIRLEDIAPAIDTTEYATLQGGISIGPCRSVYLEPPEVETAGNYIFVGTLGCIVRDNATNQAMMLSNFHVMCINDGWSAGDTMAQPSRVDGGACPADVVGTLTRAELTSSVDAAVATISGRPNDCSIVDIGDVQGTAAAAVDMAVRKRGRTTELTHGIVTATDYTTSVDYGDGLGTVTLTNQIRIVNDAAQSAFFGKKGDSGSVVVNDDERVVGLYFAGNSTGTVGVANPIAAVLTALDVSMCTGGVKVKELHKEIFKEFVPEKYRKLEVKELEKERLKDFVKDWKEFAYEKFGAFETYEPWRPVEMYPPGGPVAPRMPGRPGVTGIRGGVAPAWDVRAVDGCLDFTGLAPGPGPNPLSAPPFDITVFDHTGTPMPQTAVDAWGAHTGLNAGWALEAKVRGECPIIQATLVHFVQGATLEAWNADGTHAGSATMSPTQNVAQTLTIQGTAIVRARVTSHQNETLLLRLCCCSELRCEPGGKAKEWKDKEPVKELKEFKEPKEFKEWKEPWKELKEPREVKDVGEFKTLRETVETRPPELGGSSVEERLARLEAMFGATSHFIPQDLRPDLGRGALRREPDQGRSRRRVR